MMLNIYLLGFTFPLQVEARSEKSKSAIQEKCSMYLDRAEVIKKYLEKEKRRAEKQRECR